MLYNIDQYGNLRKLLVHIDDNKTSIILNFDDNSENILEIFDVCLKIFYEIKSSNPSISKNNDCRIVQLNTDSHRKINRHNNTPVKN